MSLPLKPCTANPELEKLVPGLKPLDPATAFADVLHVRDAKKLLRAPYGDMSQAAAGHLPPMTYLCIEGVYAWVAVIPPWRPGRPETHELRFAIPFDDDGNFTAYLGEGSTPTTQYVITHGVHWQETKENVHSCREWYETVYIPFATKHGIWTPPPKERSTAVEAMQITFNALYHYNMKVLGRVYGAIVRARIRNIEAALATDQEFRAAVQTRDSIEKTQASFMLMEKLGQLREVHDLVVAGIKRGSMSHETIDQYSKILGELGGQRNEILIPLRTHFAEGKRKAKK